MIGHTWLARRRWRRVQAELAANPGYRAAFWDTAKALHAIGGHPLPFTECAMTVCRKNRELLSSTSTPEAG